jgi:hypothetical protein
MFYTREQAAELKLSEATEALKLITKQYNLDKPLRDCFQEVWPVLDELVNSILYLEDHIHYLNDARYTAQNEALIDEVESNPDIDELIEL